MSDEVKNVNDPITPEERDAWIANLSDSEKVELRRLQLLEAAKAKAQPMPEPDWGRLSDAEFLRERMKRYGY
jgi:hypothetical protein